MGDQNPGRHLNDALSGQTVLLSPVQIRIQPQTDG